MIDLVVQGGKLVLPDACHSADLAIDRGRIVAVGTSATMPKARRIVDARGHYVLPGGIDPHVHVRWPFLAATTADDYASASMAAAIGGTTTLIDFAHPKMGSTLLERVTNRRAEADGNVAIDYSLHCVMTEGVPESLEQMGVLVEAGVTSFKLYMAYRRRGIMVDDAALFSVMRHASKLGALVCVHAENGTIADAHEAQFVAQGRVKAADFPRHKPNYVEAEAIQRAIFWARQTGARLYIFHLSTADGLSLVREAQEQGVRVIAETCPQYLLLDESVYDRPVDGHCFICSPPIRSASDKEALWEGIAQGVITVIGTDHCAFTLEQKNIGQNDFTQVPNGLPGLETRISLLHTEGVVKGRISVNQLAAITSLNPAHTFGIFPRKGILAPDSDADIVVFDPAREWALSPKELHMNVDWSPYAGWKLQGAPVTTISRGEVIVDGGEFVGTSGRGRFMQRAHDTSRVASFEGSF